MSLQVVGTQPNCVKAEKKDLLFLLLLLLLLLLLQGRCLRILYGFNWDSFFYYSLNMTHGKMKGNSQFRLNLNSIFVFSWQVLRCWNYFFLFAYLVFLKLHFLRNASSSEAIWPFLFFLFSDSLVVPELSLLLLLFQKNWERKFSSIHCQLFLPSLISTLLFSCLVSSNCFTKKNPFFFNFRTVYLWWENGH